MVQQAATKKRIRPRKYQNSGVTWVDGVLCSTSVFTNSPGQSCYTAASDSSTIYRCFSAYRSSQISLGDRASVLHTPLSQGPLIRTTDRYSKVVSLSKANAL